MHVVIVGCGRVGSTLGRELVAAGHTVAVVDRKSEAFSRLGESFSGQKIAGIGFDRDILIEAGIEKAVAATKSYSAQLLLSYIFVSIWVNEKIDLSKLIKETKVQVDNISVVEKVVDDFDHKHGVTVMGRGFAYANAHEAALKIQETLKVPVASFSSADYLHGPISSLTQNSRVILLSPGNSADESISATVKKTREITNNIYWIGTGFKKSGNEVLIGGSTGLGEAESVIADAVVLQQFAMLLAIKNGLNPDAPIGLLKVTQTI